MSVEDPIKPAEIPEVKPEPDAVLESLQKPEEKKEEEPILQAGLPSQVSVARNHPLSYYVDRSRRILRDQSHLIVKGRGPTISMACTLVEVLKRQKIALIKKVSTGMDTQAFFISSGDARWSNPAAMITFELGRAELAEYVSDYHQRKVIEIFEKHEEMKDGHLPFTGLSVSCKVLDGSSKPLSVVFKTDPEREQQAQKFLSAFDNKMINLPDFIKYCSLLIHPLLKDKEFKRMLKDEFGIDDEKKTHEDVDSKDKLEEDDTVEVD